MNRFFICRQQFLFSYCLFNDNKILVLIRILFNPGNGKHVGVFILPQFHPPKKTEDGIEKSFYQPSTHANTNGATIVASLSTIYFGV